jgi:hypothetical protein
VMRPAALIATTILAGCLHTRGTTDTEIAIVSYTAYR